MKRTKFYFMSLLMAFMGLAVTSCSSDDDNDGGSPIVGTWEQAVYYSNGSKFAQTLVFNADNTGTRTTTLYNSSGVSVGSVKYPFSYKYDDEESSIFVIFEDGDKWDGSAKIAGNKLNLNILSTSAGTTERLNYTLEKK